MEAPPFSNLEEDHDDSLFNYLNCLSPLNSPAMDYSLFTSPDVNYFEDSTFFIARDNLLDTSEPHVSCENVNNIYSHENVVPTYSTQTVQYGSCSPEYQSLISRDDDDDDVNYLLGLLGMQEPNVQDDSMKDSIEGGMYIPELGQTGNDELVRIRHSIQMGFLDYEKTSYTSNITSCSSKSDERNASNEKPLVPRESTSDSLRCVLQGNLNVIPASNHYKGIENEMTFCRRNPELPSSTSSLHQSESHLSQVPASMENHLGPSENEVQSTKDFTKFLVHITGEDFCPSTLKMTSKELDPSNMEKKRKDQIDLVGSCSKHEKEEERDDFCQRTTLKKKRKIHKSGHCQCKKSSCLRKYCECLKGGVGCSLSCKCQGCENIYGRKDREAETKSELEETEALQISRPLVPLSYLSLENPQRSCAELFGRQNQELVESNAIYCKTKLY